MRIDFGELAPKSVHLRDGRRQLRCIAIDDISEGAKRLTVARPRDSEQQHGVLNA